MDNNSYRAGDVGVGAEGQGAAVVDAIDRADGGWKIEEEHVYLPEITTSSLARKRLKLGMSIFVQSISPISAVTFA